MTEPIINRAYRNDALSRLATVIEEIWGDRCSMNEAGCPVCAAWAVFDCMDKLTDSEYLTKEDDNGSTT